MNPGRNETLMHHAANPDTPSGGTTIATGWCMKCQRVAMVKMVGQDCPVCKERLESREWPASAAEYRITAQFEEEIRRRARAAYQDTERSDPVEAAAMRREYSKDFSAGSYNWEDRRDGSTNHVREALGKPWGAMYLMFLLLRRAAPKNQDGTSTMTEELARSIWDANFDDAMLAFMWALGIVGNPKAPATDSGVGATTSGREVLDGIKEGIDRERDRLMLANQRTLTKAAEKRAKAPPVAATFDH